MDRWIIEQHIDAFRNSKITPEAASNGILNAVLMSETDTISFYQFAKTGLEIVCVDKPELGKVLCKMMDGLIEDEGNHAASAMKAAAIIGGIKPPKPEEYDKAVKSNG